MEPPSSTSSTTTSSTSSTTPSSTTPSSTTTSSTSTTPFWSKDVSVLWTSLSVDSFIPAAKQTYTERLNSATRLTIVMSLLIAWMSSGIRRLFSLMVGAATVGCIWLLHEQSPPSKEKEAFYSPVEATESDLTGSNIEDIVDVGMLNSKKWRAPTANNPYGNLIPGDDFTRLPAPPAYIPEIRNQIIKLYKEETAIPTSQISPTSNQRIYGDVSEQLSLAQSERTYYTTASTSMPPGGNADYIIGNPSAWKDQALNM